MSTSQQADPSAGGFAGRLAPEVLASVGAISRVARALVTAASLEELAQRGLSEMRDVLELELATLYLPDPAGRPVLQRHVTAADGRAAIDPAEEIVFDEEAWRLAVSTGAPLIFHEPGSWLVENPFHPPANYWLVLPLNAERRLIGVVVGAAREPIALEPTAATVLTLIGDLLTAGISSAQLRATIEQTELEREQARLAELVHDGLAQDLALATREVSLLKTGPELGVAQASLERLGAAIGSAHTLVRERLRQLAAPDPLGGLDQSVADICERFRERGMMVRLRHSGTESQIQPGAQVAVVRVLTEALTNVEKHAGCRTVDVILTVEDARLTLRITDDGVGFAVESASGPDTGNFGLLLMNERARRAGGTLWLNSQPGAGTTVQLQLPR